ncbi:MAG: DNA polymerase III subunit alpha, partial [Campylobacteraceae bacterium]|nr:DNA polymerase III subunit alpha [Campylobacteraceae bacterium]
MSQPRFTHLHLHTEYSLLDGANRIEDLAKTLKNQGVNSVAITDHGNMFGAIDFYKTMQKSGIKPIIGIEAYLHNSENIDDKSTRQRFHLCLYAKNITGYKNLMYLSSISYLDGFYYYPRINKEILRSHSEGLICSSACLQGEVNWHLNMSNPRNVQFGAKGYERAKEVALEYKEIFKDDFYLEIMRHGIDDQRYIDDDIIRISQETGIKIIATNDTHYPFKEYAEPHEAFMCIAMNKEFDDPNRLRHSVHEFYLKSPEDMARLFADIPEALENTQEIVEKCNLDLDLGNPTPPNFKFTLPYAKEADLVLPEPNLEYSLENDKIFFIYQCKKGLKERLLHVEKDKHEIYHQRLKIEMDIINSMKFPGYMLIVWDFIKEAKSRDIPVGPGRGSAAGSLVAFALKITDIDPMPYNLLFERFLNPERVSMPDIDVDFCQSRRGEIINYVVEKYGRYNVAQVITFGKMLAKGVIRDVARVLGVPYAEADRMAKLIPDELGITLNGEGEEGESGFKAGAFQKEPKLRELIETSPDAARVWKFALALEGLNRNAGMHAAGVVISNEELWSKTPLYKPSGEEHLVTQYSLKYLEDVDLIKFDFLGLKTLTVIDNAIKLIKNRFNKTINWNEISLEESKVFKTIQSGHTIGLFQIESSGMQQLNAKLKPTSFEDIIAVLALYRPGPMESGMLNDFIDRKHGRAEIEYMFPELETILKPTYGVIVYQEQVMQIVQTIGGFSLGGADLVRRAMGKKVKKELDELKAQFVKGAAEKGFDKAKAADLFDLIVKFAGYGFNKSHSAAYALITYQTAWLKTFYPQEFMAALLTSEQDKTEKIVKYIDEVKRLGIHLLPPSVLNSQIEFTGGKTEDGEDAIIFGLGAVKGVGHGAIKSIVEAREERPFEGLSDFISRVDTQRVNKKVLEALIKSGALDYFEYSRRAMFDQVEIIVEAAHKVTQAKKMAENSLFGENEEMTSVNIEIQPLGEYELKHILLLEKESIGFYISGHPLDDFKEQMKDLKYTLSSEFENIEDGSQALVVGKVEEIVSKFSKRGNRFGIINLMDLHGNLEITAFEKDLAKLESMSLDEPLAFKVAVNKDDRFLRIRTLKIMQLEDMGKEKV